MVHHAVVVTHVRVRFQVVVFGTGNIGDATHCVQSQLLMMSCTFSNHAVFVVVSRLHIPLTILGASQLAMTFVHCSLQDRFRTGLTQDSHS
ncbi:hypothetical protein GW750_04135 [bacterium]|nr:hypothetical protein [bacterium]